MRRSRRFTMALGGCLALAVAALVAIVVVIADGGSHEHDPVAGVFSYDRARPLEVSATPARQEGTVNVQGIRYDGFDGERVPAVLATPIDDRRTRGCLMLQPGIGGDKDDLRGLWEGIAGLGLATFSIDPRSSGERVEDPVSTLRSTLEDPIRLRSLLVDSVRDLRRGLDYLETRSECQGNFAYMGISFGGALGAMLGGSEERIRAAILISTGPSWRRSANVRQPLVLPNYADDPAKLAEGLAHLDDLDPVKWVKRMAPRPLMLVIGRSDPFVPPADRLAFTRAVSGPKVVVTYEGGHDPNSSPDSEAIGARIESFLREEILDK